MGRHNALEFVVAGGRPVARRFRVYACRIEGDTIVSAELSDEPVETIRLPLTREQAEGWVLTHFEDLERARQREIVGRLTRPTGTMVARKTGPLA